MQQLKAAGPPAWNEALAKLVGRLDVFTSTVAGPRAQKGAVLYNTAIYIEKRRAVPVPTQVDTSNKLVCSRGVDMGTTQML